MPFVRRRTTSAGNIVTTLVESYRDDQGRPRQRVLANLHGADSADHALARLSAVRSRLKKELVEVEKEAVQVRAFQAGVAIKGFGHLTREELREVLSLNRAGNRILEREKRLKTAMKATQRDGSKLQRFRTWDDAAMQAAIKDELKGIERVMTENIGERALTQIARRRQSAGAAKLRQLGASALFDERYWISFARAIRAGQPAT